METINNKVLSLLIETGSTTASEIATLGAKRPHHIIYSLRKSGVPISACRLLGNEKVYYIKSKFKQQKI